MNMFVPQLPDFTSLFNAMHIIIDFRMGFEDAVCNISYNYAVQNSTAYDQNYARKL